MSATAHLNPMGSYNRMVALGIYDPVDKRNADFVQKKTWAVQAWCTAFGLYGFHALKKAGYFKQIANTRGAYIAVMGFSSIVPGIIMTITSASFYTKLDDKYFPLYVDHIKKQSEDDSN